MHRHFISWYHVPLHSSYDRRVIHLGLLADLEPSACKDEGNFTSYSSQNIIKVMK